VNDLIHKKEFLFFLIAYYCNAFGSNLGINITMGLVWSMYE